MEFIPFNTIHASLGTQIAKLGIIPKSKLFNKIVKVIKQKEKLSDVVIKKSLLSYITTYKKHILENRDIKKLKDWTLDNTTTKMIPYVNKAIENYIHSILNTNDIKLAPTKDTKRRTTKKFNYMLNQITLKVNVNSTDQVTVMCFSNLSLTLTGCTNVDYGQQAVDSLINSYHSFEIVKQPKVVMTTAHISFDTSFDLAELANHINKTIANARAFYEPDASSYLNVNYASETDQKCKFIIRESGKIMLSSNNKLEYMRAGYNAIIGTIIDYVNSTQLCKFCGRKHLIKLHECYICGEYHCEYECPKRVKLDNFIHIQVAEDDELISDDYIIVKESSIPGRVVDIHGVITNTAFIIKFFNITLKQGETVKAYFCVGENNPKMVAKKRITKCLVAKKQKAE